MADWNGVPLRRRLRSADRLSDIATFRGVLIAKTLGSRSSALLVTVTRCDQREGETGDFRGMYRMGAILRPISVNPTTVCPPRISHPIDILISRARADPSP